jgi:hypothetical protein
VEVPLEMLSVVGVASVGNSGNPYANNTHYEQGAYAVQSLQGSYTVPGCYRLAQNYPNPFNPTTTIRYDLPFESKVKLQIFDLMGRLVATLVDGKQQAGFRMVRWDGHNKYGTDLASGVYFYRLQADATTTYLGKKEHFERTQKMVMVK